MAQINIDKNLYNDIVAFKIENEQLINDLYESFNNFTSDELAAAIEIIHNFKIINDEYNKYIVIYNNSVANQQQSDEYITIEGDTFQSIAQTMTGNYNNWKKIMEFNEIKDPFIESGVAILIPRNL